MNAQFQQEVSIPVGNVKVHGELIVPPKAKAIIIFSHGSGSSRFSKRNRQVAAFLQARHFGTLLFDLLTEKEDEEYQNRFNIDLLTQRLIRVTEWLEKHPAAKDCRFGFFGASTGAASALKAAARLPQVEAVVSRGGRPDLAAEDLQRVQAPVLLIVGSLDYDVLQLNRMAYQQLRGEKKLAIVEGATHLFEEPGTMDKVADLSAEWFEHHLLPIPI